MVASGWDDVHIDKPPLYDIPVVASEWASSSEPPLYAIPAVASEWADVYEHKRPQVKSPTTVACDYDNYSLTSNSGNSSLDMNAVDDDCGPSGYNDDFMQGIEKPTSPIISEKVCSFDLQ